MKYTSLFLSLGVLALIFAPKSFAAQDPAKSWTAEDNNIQMSYELDQDNWLHIYWDVQNPEPGRTMIPDHVVIMPHDQYNTDLDYYFPQKDVTLAQPEVKQGKTYPYGFTYRVRPGVDHFFQLSQFNTFEGDGNAPPLRFMYIGYENGTCFDQASPRNSLMGSLDLVSQNFKSYGESYKLPGVFFSIENSSFDWQKGIYKVVMTGVDVPFTQNLDILFRLKDSDGNLIREVQQTFTPDQIPLASDALTKTAMGGPSEQDIDFGMDISNRDYVFLDIIPDPNHQILDRTDLFGNDNQGGFENPKNLPETVKKRDALQASIKNPEQDVDCHIQPNGVGIAYNKATGQSYVPVDEIMSLFTPSIIQSLQAYRQREIQVYGEHDPSGLSYEDFQNSKPDYPVQPGHFNATEYYKGEEKFFPLWFQDLEKRETKKKNFIKAQMIYEGKGDESFIDVSSQDWFSSLVEKAKQDNVIRGKTDSAGNVLNLFDPGSTVSKAELLKIAYLAAGLDPAPSTGGDYPNHWAHDYWQDAKGRNLELVKSGGPDDGVYRRDAVRFMIELLQIPLETDISNLAEYQDVPKDAPLAKYVYTALKRGAIIQRSNFNPDEKLNRAEQLAFVYHFLSAVGK